jgi:hypothetical protein
MNLDIQTLLTSDALQALRGAYRRALMNAVAPQVAAAPYPPSKPLFE